MTQPLTSSDIAAALADPARLRAVATVLAGMPHDGVRVRRRFDRLARVAARLLRVPWVTVCALDDRTAQLIGAAGLPPALDEPGAMPVWDTPCVRVIAGAAPLALTGTPDAPLARDWPLAQLLGGAQAYLGVPVCTADDAVVGALAVLADRPRQWLPEEHAALEEIAALVGTELALHAAEDTGRRFRAIIERTRDLVLLLDARGRVTYASPAALRVLGVAPARLVGRPVLGYVHRGDAPAAAGRLAQLLDGAGTTAELRVRVRHGVTGQWHVLHVLGEDLAHDPEVQAVVVTARDVTAHERLAEQYRQSLKMEAVGQLAGGIAHDFNNLLTVLAASARFVREALPPTVAAEVAPDLDEIDHGVRRAAGLTRQLLAFSRRQPQSVRALRVGDVVRGMESMMRRLIGESIELGIERGDGEAVVHADPGQLEQVVLNLVVNARDAMPEGGVLIVETHAVVVTPADAAAHGVAAGPWVVLDVSDTGVGMDAATLARVFEPFFTTKAAGAGTGLGLATVYGIVAQSRGTVRVHSTPGEGTHVRVWLPRHTGAVESLHLGGPIGTAGDGTAADGGLERTTRARAGERVLLVEDEGALRQVVTRTLARHGYTVLAARHGADALALYAAHGGPAGAIALVLTDLTMPEMSGRALVTRLRTLRPAQRILAMSGYAVGDDRAWAEQAGLPVLDKPFTAPALASAVRAALDEPPPDPTSATTVGLA